MPPLFQSQSLRTRVHQVDLTARAGHEENASAPLMGSSAHGPRSKPSDPRPPDRTSRERALSDSNLHILELYLQMLGCAQKPQANMAPRFTIRLWTRNNAARFRWLLASQQFNCFFKRRSNIEEPDVRRASGQIVRIQGAQRPVINCKDCLPGDSPLFSLNLCWIALEQPNVPYVAQRTSHNAMHSVEVHFQHLLALNTPHTLVKPMLSNDNSSSDHKGQNCAYSLYPGCPLRTRQAYAREPLAVLRRLFFEQTLQHRFDVHSYPPRRPEEHGSETGAPQSSDE